VHLGRQKEELELDHDHNLKQAVIVVIVQQPVPTQEVNVGIWVVDVVERNCFGMDHQIERVQQ
jgi:hypothetical protein